MGAEVLIPLAIAAAGTGVGVANQEAAARRADRIAAQGIREQGVRQTEANARVDQEVANVAGSNAEGERQAANAQYMDQLRRSRAAARGMTDVPGASSRYSEEVAEGDQAVDSTAARVADLMSRVNAPLMQRDRELQGFDRLRSDVGVIGRAAAGDDFLNQLRLRSVRPNPWVGALGQLAQGYGMGRLASGFAGGGATTDPLQIPASSTTTRLPTYGTRLV